MNYRISSNCYPGGAVFQPRRKRGAIKGNTVKELNNNDIIELANKSDIKSFRGVFMRDNLPNKINDKECGIFGKHLKSNSRSVEKWAFHEQQRELYNVYPGSNILEFKI